MTITSQYFHMLLLPIYFKVFFFLLCLTIGPSFMSISSLVLELWQFFFIRDLIRNPQLGNTHFWELPISGDWGNLGILKLAQMFLIIYYWMLQNTRNTDFNPYNGIFNFIHWFYLWSICEKNIKNELKEVFFKLNVYDYATIYKSETSNIHKYLMDKSNI